MNVERSEPITLRSWMVLVVVVSVCLTNRSIFERTPWRSERLCETNIVRVVVDFAATTIRRFYFYFLLFFRFRFEPSHFIIKGRNFIPFRHGVFCVSPALFGTKGGVTRRRIKRTEELALSDPVDPTAQGRRRDPRRSQRSNNEIRLRLFPQRLLGRGGIQRQTVVRQRF